MATHAASTRNITGLARALAQHGLMTEFEAEALQTQAHQAGVPFVDHVIAGQEDLVDASSRSFASRAFGVPLFDLSGFDVDQYPKELVDLKIAQARHVLPLHKRGNRLYVATSDPRTCQGLEEIRFKTNLVVEPVVVENDKLAASIHKLVEASGATLKDVSSMEDLEVDLQEPTCLRAPATRKAPRSRTRRSSATCRRS
jgi:type IV pilus assembly protein PilB